MPRFMFFVFSITPQESQLTMTVSFSVSGEKFGTRNSKVLLELVFPIWEVELDSRGRSS